ncbi:MAG: hypothetical protein JWO52_2440 [Gammaproteobacteria bacterium]|jgi:hypothetical protein|nr:hypothetical protein [Gammaproteobacteria bacterium]
MATRNGNKAPQGHIGRRSVRKRRDFRLGPRAESPPIDPSPIRRPNAVRKSMASKLRARDRDLQDPLADITRRLKVIGAIAITAHIALRTQNCEQDADIAECLRHGVVDALATQIERIGQLCIHLADTP